MREKYNKDEKKIQQKYFSASCLMPKDYITNTAVHSSKPISARNQHDELEMTYEERNNFIQDKQNQNKQSNLHDSILSVFQTGTIQALADQKQTARRRKKELHDLANTQKHSLENIEEISSDVNALQNQNVKLKKAGQVPKTG